MPDEAEYTAMSPCHILLITLPVCLSSQLRKYDFYYSLFTAVMCLTVWSGEKQHGKCQQCDFIVLIQATSFLSLTFSSSGRTEMCAVIWEELIVLFNRDC